MIKLDFVVADLLPHESPMVLLDYVQASGADYVMTAVQIESGKPFFVDGHGVPTYVGLEYMAQSCGVFAGIQSQIHNRPIALGFLLGTRNYHVAQAWFVPGCTIMISVKETFRQDQMGVFDCHIECDDVTLGTAQLSLYQSNEVI